MKNDVVKSFALDRLNHLETSGTAFEFPENFDVTAYYTKWIYKLG